VKWLEIEWLEASGSIHVYLFISLLPSIIKDSQYVGRLATPKRSGGETPLQVQAFGPEPKQFLHGREMSKML